MIRSTSLLFLFGILALSTPAAAQTASASRTEAAERFDRALRLVNVGDLSGGLAEFQRAYSLVPSPVVGYNVGLVYAALHRPVESARELSQALAQAEALTVENAERARRVLREQEESVGHVELVANVKEGVVELDNVQVGKLPLDRPLDVSSGPHVVGVVATGYAPARREVVVAGRQTVDVRLELTAIEGLLAHIAVRSRVPAANVFVDGERVGQTPLESTVSVAPGAHQVEVRRPGYASASRNITLQGGALAELALTPLLDPAALGTEGGYLAVEASESQAVVTIDGEELGLLKSPLQLARGAHRLHLERGGFVAAERDVEVPLRKTAKVSVVFEPTPETRAQYVSSAKQRRTWTLVTLGTGIAIAAAGTALAVVEQGRLPAARSKLDAAKADAVKDSGRACDIALAPSDEALSACLSRLKSATARVDNLHNLRTAGWIGAGVGGAAAITGLVLLLTGDEPGKYDEKPRNSMLAGWRLMPNAGVGFFSLSGVGTF